MGGDGRRKFGISRCMSVDSFKLDRQQEVETSRGVPFRSESKKKPFQIKAIRYRTFPKNYKDVPEDIWHWAPLPASDKDMQIVSNKNELYMKTLTYQDIDDLDQILLNKMR